MHSDPVIWSVESLPQEKLSGKKTAALIIVANDASDNTKKMFENQCKHYQVPFYCWGLKEELGHAIGKEFRASIAVTDQGFAEALFKTA